LLDLQAWRESRLFDFSTMRLFHGLDLLFSEWRQELSLRAVVSDTVSSDGEGTRLVSELNMFVLEVLQAWTDPAQKHPKTIHHHGYGKFAVDGKMIKLKSRKP
jgi:hypothetical protein